MYLIGFGHRRIPLGGAGYRDCRGCRAECPVQADLEYRYFHVFWLIGAIVTRRYHLSCRQCGAEVEARLPRLKTMVRAEKTRVISLGPLFLIFLGGALVLVGPGDFSD